MADPLSLEECVRAYLSLVMKPPEKEPKRVRDQRDNRMLIIGFNRAQEALRTILEHHGATDEIAALADVRKDGQERSIEIGGTKAWVAS